MSRSTQHSNSIWLLIHRSILLVLGGFFLLTLASKILQAQDVPDDLESSIADIISSAKEKTLELPVPQTAAHKLSDTLTNEAVDSLIIAQDALKRGDLNTAIDVLQITKGTLNVALQQLTKTSTSTLLEAGSSANTALKENKLLDAGLSKIELTHLNSAISRMAEARTVSKASLDGIFERLSREGIDMGDLTRTLENNDLNTNDVIRGINFDASNFSDLANALSTMANDPESMAFLSREAGAVFADMGTSLNTVAESVALAIEAGVNVDLESMSQGLGYNSFASAVDAYNAANGTDLSVDDAKKALGQ